MKLCSKRFTIIKIVISLSWAVQAHMTTHCVSGFKKANLKTHDADQPSRGSSLLSIPRVHVMGFNLL